MVINISMVIGMDMDYNIRNDSYFLGYITSRDITEVSKEKYAKELTKLCKSIDMEFGEIIKKCQIQQRTRIVEDENNPKESILVEFDVNSPDSLAKIAQDSFVDFCKERGNTNITINNGVVVLRSFFKSYKIKLPIWKPLDENYEDWEPLTKEDFIFVMKDSSLIHQSLITFMLSSGIRIGDCLKLTIKDFMKATSDYHDFKDVNDFIDNAPEDMLGYWKFDPKKTKRYKIKCSTMNSAESSNYILQNLRRIKNQYLPRKSKRIKKELKMSKNDALFGSHHKMYKEPMTVKSITDQFTLKNHKLHEWRVNQIKNDIAQGKYSEEDFEDLEKEIPKFHAHACRKFFIDTLDKKCADSRLRSLMEGHKPVNKNDPSYVKKKKKDVMEVYKTSLLEHVTLENIEARFITGKEGEELRNEIAKLRGELESQRQIGNISVQVEDDIWKVLRNHHRSKKHRGEYIEDGGSMQEYNAEADVLCQYALEFAIKDIINFNANDEEYIDSLFDKARAVNELYPDDFDKVHKRASSHYSVSSHITGELKSKVDKILVSSSNYGHVEEIVKSNYKLAEKSVARYLNENPLTMEELDDKNLVKEILFEVIMNI